MGKDNVYSSRAINMNQLIALQSLMSEENDVKQRLLLHTSYGFITGIPVSNYLSFDTVKDFLEAKKDKNGGISFDLSILPVMKKQAMEGNDINQESLIGDGSMLILEDAKIYQDNLANPVLSINSFVVHISDIIGFSFTESNSAT